MSCGPSTHSQSHPRFETGRVIHTTESTGAGGGRGEGGSRGRRYMDIHIVIRQKPTQHYKAIILQLEKKKELKV